MINIGLQSIAVAYPPRRMTNDYWRRKYPELVHEQEHYAGKRVWTTPTSPRPFETAMRPYFNDAFMGAKVRRWLAPGQPVLELEVEASRLCLQAAGLSTADVDVALVSAIMPDQYDVGNATYLAQALDLRAAWNVESMCSSAVVSLQAAIGLVASGQAKRVLVVVSCAYSRFTDENDPLCWANGDGAAALLIGAVEAGAGFLASHTHSSWPTNGALITAPENTPSGILMRMRPQPGAGKKIADNAAPQLVECIGEVLRKCSHTLDDIDFFALPAGVAWMADFVTATLPIPRDKLLMQHDRYANTGPVMTPTHLFAALHEGRVKAGDLTLLFGIGSASNAASAVLRLGHVSLGPVPADGVEPA
jgi:3-oxoacyl-[acyl-carrier-protein] synthase III